MENIKFNKQHLKIAPSRRAFLIINTSLLVLFAFVCLVPFLNLLATSLSSNDAVNAGAVGFLANLRRELLSFLTIPWIARRLDHYTAIAPAGATSEDTTLALLIRCTREEVVVLAVVNGVLCSAAVPFLIRFFYGILA